VTGDGNNETGWSNAEYDRLIATANQQTDLHRRAQLFQQAETILVHQELPIIPLYIYSGINYFDTNRIQGIWENVLDDHPLTSLRKLKPRP